MKGQVSTELLVIVALVLLIFIPLLVLVYMEASKANQQIGTYQAELAVTRISSLANSVGSLGTDTSIVTDVYIPPNVVSLETVASGRGGEVVMVLNTPDGPHPVNDIVKYPIVNPHELAGAGTPAGWMRLNISSVYSDGVAKVRIEKVS
ncbi:MAG: hypothetical protein V1827_00200 [Candidatus Micrarchaeota archaeon]